MKKIAIYVTLLIIGVTSGFTLAINLFAVETDLLWAPYSNSPVALTESITIEQGDITIELPKGSVITYKYAPKGMPIYLIDLVGDYGSILKTQPQDKKRYFNILTNEKISD